MVRLVQIERIPNHRATDPEVKTEYEKKCQSCGACCSYYSWQSAKVEGNTPALIAQPKLTFKAVRIFKYLFPDGATEIQRFVTYWMRRKKDRHGWWRCIALKGEIGVSVQCTVYADRSDACRNFEPGSEQCIKIRQWARIEVLHGQQ